MNELRTQAAALIINKLKEKTVAIVASDLGISRQAVYDIKKGKYSPSLSLVHKACEVWKVPFTYQGIVIDAASFKPKANRQPRPMETQGDLFDHLAKLDTSRFEVIQAKPAGRALDITIRLSPPHRKNRSA
jgi:DNA-binding XRE family transcriptional regulator